MSLCVGMSVYVCQGALSVCGCVRVFCQCVGVVEVGGGSLDGLVSWCVGVCQGVCQNVCVRGGGGGMFVGWGGMFVGGAVNQAWEMGRLCGATPLKTHPSSG